MCLSIDRRGEDIFAFKARFSQVSDIGKFKFLGRPFCTVRPFGSNCAARSLDEIGGGNKDMKEVVGESNGAPWRYFNSENESWGKRPA